MKLAHIYHNMGVLFQAGKDYAKAVEAYKMSLRNNPADHETRYNLALAQKMLKDQQQNQDQNQDQNKDQQQKQDQKQDQIKTKQNDQRKMKKRISNNLQNLKRRTIKCRRRMQNNYLIL